MLRNTLSILAVLMTLTSAASIFASEEEGQKTAGSKAPSSAKAEKEYPALLPGMGTLEGTVTLKGTVPELKTPDVPANNKDHDFCVKHVKNETLIVGPKGGIKNVVVTVAGYKPASKPKPREIKLDNRDCLFVPHVQATTRNSTLVLGNSDKFLHNVHGVLGNMFNVAVPSGGKVTKKLRRSGWTVIKCDIHTWMEAHVMVFEHDLFDVSDGKGHFKIVNIPPGEYDIAIWHKRLAFQFNPKTWKKPGKVTIEAGKTAKLDFTLDAK